MKRVMTVTCTVCGTKMSRSESTSNDNLPICQNCLTRMIEEFEAKKSKEAHTQKRGIYDISHCDYIARKMQDAAFPGFWAKAQEAGTETFSQEYIAKEFFVYGATSMLGFLLSTGMPPEILKDIEVAIEMAKKRAWEVGGEKGKAGRGRKQWK